MKDERGEKVLRRMLISTLLLCASACVAWGVGAISAGHAHAQQTIPPVPQDIKVIYFTDAENKLLPLPFEEATASVPVQWNVAATSDRTGYVELKGEHSPFVITNADARFYLFVMEKSDVPPPFLVRLKQKKGARRIRAIVERGKPWFAPLEEEVVKPNYRVLETVGLQIPRGILPALYMEVRPQRPLSPGEYAFIGKGLATTSTFRIAATTTN